METFEQWSRILVYSHVPGQISVLSIIHQTSLCFVFLILIFQYFTTIMFSKEVNMIKTIKLRYRKVKRCQSATWGWVRRSYNIPRSSDD